MTQDDGYFLITCDVMGCNAKEGEITASWRD